MLCELTSRWYANAETRSKVGASWRISSRAKWQDSMKRWWCSWTLPLEAPCHPSRKRSSGAPCTLVITRRTRQTSAPAASTSVATRAGIRDRGPSRVPPLPPSMLPQSAAGSSLNMVAYEPPACSCMILKRLPSNVAFASSCGVRHRISLMATSPLPSRSSAAHTAPKLPMPSGFVTWHVQLQIFRIIPGVSLGSRTPSAAKAACFWLLTYRR
mmetsp:Transcript_99732/g.282244  ORF Transcript_99732/g.282244 Transcript_99732/m.282244 type:complete len:213 (+) Transcript_99732:147-785(+)